MYEWTNKWKAFLRSRFGVFTILLESFCSFSLQANLEAKIECTECSNSGAAENALLRWVLSENPSSGCFLDTWQYHFGHDMPCSGNTLQGGPTSYPAPLVLLFWNLRKGWHREVTERTQWSWGALLSCWDLRSAHWGPCWGKVRSHWGRGNSSGCRNQKVHLNFTFLLAV